MRLIYVGRGERERERERERTGQKYEGILLYTKMISRCSVLLIIKNMM